MKGSVHDLKSAFRVSIILVGKTLISFMLESSWIRGEKSGVIRKNKVYTLMEPNLRDNVELFLTL